MRTWVVLHDVVSGTCTRSEAVRVKNIENAASRGTAVRSIIPLILNVVTIYNIRKTDRNPLL